jgi:hypothetical protein
MSRGRIRWRKSGAGKSGFKTDLKFAESRGLLLARKVDVRKSVGVRKVPQPPSCAEKIDRLARHSAQCVYREHQVTAPHTYVSPAGRWPDDKLDLDGMLWPHSITSPAKELGPLRSGAHLWQRRRRLRPRASSFRKYRSEEIVRLGSRPTHCLNPDPVHSRLGCMVCVAILPCGVLGAVKSRNGLSTISRWWLSLPEDSFGCY